MAAVVGETLGCSSPSSPLSPACTGSVDTDRTVVAGDVGTAPALPPPINPGARAGGAGGVAVAVDVVAGDVAGVVAGLAFFACLGVSAALWSVMRTSLDLHSKSQRKLLWTQIPSRWARTTML